MRFLIRAKIPTEAGNKMVQDPNFLKNLEDYMSKAKPESAHFFAADGVCQKQDGIELGLL